MIGVVNCVLDQVGSLLRLRDKDLDLSVVGSTEMEGSDFDNVCSLLDDNCDFVFVF